jgi:hypothetical protein
MQLAAAEAKHRHALGGLVSSLESFRGDAVAAGLTSIRDAISVKLLPKLLVLRKNPGLVVTAESFAILAEVVGFLSDLRDCSFENPGLKTSCLNTKHFAQLALNAQNEVEKLRK